MRKIIFIFIIFLVSNKSFCAGLSKSDGLWPFYFKSDNTTTIFSPFFQKSETKTVFRPFFLYENKINGDYRFYFLYPIVDFSKQGNKITRRIFPFFNTHYDSNRKMEERFTNLFPFFWGKTADNKTFGGVFPIYGRLINKFHYDEINFYMWPLYFNKKRENYTDYHFLWPFFAFGKGEGYSAFKIWPLFGYKEQKGYFKRKFFLWPLFIFQKRKINNSKNLWENKDIFFPFYIHTYSNEYNYKTFLFPFFRYNMRGENYRYYGVPWPFFTYEKNGSFFDLSIFPLIHKVHKDRYERLSIFWIIIRDEKIFSKNRESLISENLSFLLLNRFEKNYKKNTAYSNIWPFYEYWKNGDNYIFKLFEPLPLKIPGVYELYSTFFNIFYIVKHNEKFKISFLWGALSYEKDEKTSCFSVFKILKFCSDKKPIKNFSEEEWKLSYNLGT